MNYLDAAMLVRLENDLTRRLVEEWKVDLQTLFYDTTNFDTFLSSENPARLARARHVQTQRSAHRGPGAAGLLGFSYPLFSQIYEGNQNDSVTFQPGSGRSGRSLPNVPREMSQHHPGFR